MDGQFENIEIQLPDEITEHLYEGAKELMRAEFAYINKFYGDDPSDCDFEMMTQLLTSILLSYIPSACDEVEKEQG